MADNINMPSGLGGLVRFNEEYSSRIMLKPTAVIGMILFIVAFRVFLEFIY